MTVSFLCQGGMRDESVRWSLVSDGGIIDPVHGPSQLLQTKEEAGRPGQNFVLEGRVTLLLAILITLLLRIGGQVGSLWEN